MHRSCSCGHQYSNSFSMLLTVPYDQHICPYDSSSAVDCTLSLATPSTRLTSDDYYDSSETRFCWDFLQPDNPSRPPPSHKSIRGGVTNASTGDSLLARRCANCDTTSTPLWRNGPRGPKSLCNACGIRYKKEERRANAATAGAGGGLEVAATHKLPSCYSPGAVGGEFRFTDDVDDRDSTFMSWRLNVTDRAGLVHDFTRY
ncbi:putative transcription factor C2C2-GATA family [Helianthus anomalus]